MIDMGFLRLRVLILQPQKGHSHVSKSPDPACLEEAALRQLLAAGAVSSITARAGTRGFGIQAQLGEGQATLVNTRGTPRLFASLSTVAALLNRMGCDRFQVDTTGYTPGRIRPAQPARSAAMKAGKLPKAATKAAQSFRKSRTA
jgi:hypothetical protein